MVSQKPALFLFCRNEMGFCFNIPPARNERSSQFLGVVYYLYSVDLLGAVPLVRAGKFY